ncbi:MAG: putative LPS assembly protein LptD [Gemmatimonadaceae bacterium]
MTARGILCALALAATPAFAQQPIQLPTQYPTGGQFPGDTNGTHGRRMQPGRNPADSARADSLHAPRILVVWPDPDSTMAQLLQRTGYTITRYQSKDAQLNAGRHELKLSGKAVVERVQTTLVADTILYNDSLHLMRATAPKTDTIYLRDPSQGTADLLAIGRLEYDLRRHFGLVSQLSTSSAQNGQTWYIYGHAAAVKGDTTGKGHSISYAEDASITSCDLPEPHYHFQSSEVKIISKTLLVARPAVLYVSDIPVLWLPFIFQDMRSGRRSGIIPPRFSVTDIVRTSPDYVRSVDNLGYYFNINDYMDALVSYDWRSGTSNQQGDVGYNKFNGEYRYRWLNRFVSGGIRASYWTYSNGDRTLGFNWAHSQQFSQTSSLNMNLNYTSNTHVYQTDALTVAQALAAISSQLALTQKLGPFNVTAGGSRSQYSGRDLVNQDFPNFSVTTQPINLSSWLAWTPTLAVDNNQAFNLEGQTSYRYRDSSGVLDSTAIKANTRNTTVNFNTPLRIGRFQLSNSFRYSDQLNDLPTIVTQFDFNTGVQTGSRSYANIRKQQLDWDTQFSLPGVLQGTWNVAPFVSFQNADGSNAYLVKTTLSNGAWVSQSKRVQTGISASPTFFAFFPGFGPFSRLRQSIQPRLSFSYAPSSDVSDAFLLATGRTRAGYLGGLRSETMQFQFNQTLEAKLHSNSDTTPESGDKIKLLTINASPIDYDFVVAARTHRFGVTSNSFNYNLQSDLLPGFDFSSNYSLFRGDPLSDTAQFKPFRTGMTATFTIGKNSNPFKTLRRIFGSARPDTAPVGANLAGNGMNSSDGQGINALPATAGSVGSRYPFAINGNAGWNLSVSFTESQSRPVTGTNVRVTDPRAICANFPPIDQPACLQNPPAQTDTASSLVGGSTIYVSPRQSTLRGNVSFHITPRWSMQWTTGYDFALHQFSDHVVSLQRDMHDWRAIFAFTQAPNGNFSFNFFISLIAEPNLKFNFDKRTYRPATVLVAPSVVSNSAPVVHITAPANNATFAQGASVTFTGDATDAEDGPLTGASLVWRDNTSGQIGTGATFAIATLAPGPHVITLTAKDSTGRAGLSLISITITPTP